MAYNISENNVKLGQLYEIVKNLNRSVVFLESSIQEKEDLIWALGEKLVKCQVDSANSFSIVHKLIMGTQKLDEILNSTIAL